MGGYVYGKYKKDESANKLEIVEILSEAIKPTELSKAILDGKNGAEGTMFARDLVNTPGLHMAPVDLVNSAKEIAKVVAKDEYKSILQQLTQLKDQEVFG